MLPAADIFAGKILIVDDMPANVRLLEEILRGAGYTEVSSTQNPQEVCELYRQHRYDLILLDLLMPDMDGFQVLEGLKAMEADGYLPVLVITAQPRHKLRALQAGAKDFVSKPFDLVEVKTRIYNLLEVRLLYKRLENHNRILEQTVLARTAELRRSEERFHRLTELSSDWYWEQDAEGNFTHVSGPALEMLGLGGDDAAEPVGATGGRWNDEQRAELMANIAARRPFLDLIYSRRNADGAEQYFQMSGEPMFDAAGRYIGFRGIGTDITARMTMAADHSAAP